jgi:hypothetical protein
LGVRWDVSLQEWSSLQVKGKSIEMRDTLQ